MAVFIKSESWPVVGVSPHVGSRGCSGWNLNTLDPRIWSLKEVFSATNQAIGLCGFITLTLPYEFDNKNIGAAPS